MNRQESGSETVISGPEISFRRASGVLQIPACSSKFRRVHPNSDDFPTKSGADPQRPKSQSPFSENSIMAPKIAQPYLKIPIGNSISGGIAPNRFVRNGSRFLKWGELVLAANGSISRVPIVSSWRRIKAIFGTIALVEAKSQSYIDSISSFLSRFRIYRPFRHSTNFQEKEKIAS